MQMRGWSVLMLAAASVLFMGQAGGGGGMGMGGGGMARGGGRGAPPSSTLTQNRASPHDTINTRVGSGRALVIIVYGRPYSKAPNGGDVRKIWGGLVPWGQVWRLGSDEATLLVTQKALKFGDTTVPAGAYTLYMFPDENGTSKLIINKSIGQWGIPYTKDLEGTELARIDLKKDPLEKQVDQLTLAFENVPGGGGSLLKIQWENTQYSVPFNVAQ